MNSEQFKYDEVLFRVLLDREEQRPKLSFALLRATVPRTYRKAVEDDWLRYIREEEMEFDFAFQKSIRKHFPGVYHVIVAAEFLHRLAFHEALGFFLKTLLPGVTPPVIDEDKIFELAEELTRQVRERTRQLALEEEARLKTPPPTAETEAQNPIKPARPVQPTSSRPDYPKPSHPPLKPFSPGGKASKKKLKHLRQVVEAWKRSRLLGPVRRSERQAAAPPPIQRATESPSHSLPATSQPVPNPPPATRPQLVAPPAWANRFRTGLCIGCGHIPIPGDFYCYYCAPTK